MKKIVTLLAASVATLGLNAQITINQSDYTGWTPRVDTFQELRAKITLGANMSWNYDTASYDPNAFVYANTAYTNPAFPGASYSYESGYGFSVLGYDVDIAAGITANGSQEFGESVPAQAYDISALTTKAGDSLIFPAQLIPYSAPRTRIAFPLTFSKTWTSVFDRSTTFVLKYGGNTYAASRKTFTTQSDNVEGWGRIRIKRLDGSNSGWMDVLGVKTSVKTVDSFYLPGAPASTLNGLLRGFFLSQGMRDSSYAIQMFRKGEVEPVMLVGFSDPAYANADYASVHQSRIPSNVGVKNLPGAAAIKLYPNPAKASSGFDIDLIETAPGTWSYNLLDASGKVVSSSVITPNGTKAHIDAAQTAPGKYFLNLQNNGKQVATTPVVIAE